MSNQSNNLNEITKFNNDMKIFYDYLSLINKDLDIENNNNNYVRFQYELDGILKKINLLKEACFIVNEKVRKDIQNKCNHKFEKDNSTMSEKTCFICDYCNLIK